MEAIDGSNRPSGILSMINRERDDHRLNHNNSYPPPTTMAATVAMSPSFPYPNDPPPRYEVSNPSAGRSSLLHGLMSPPESRRTSDNKKEPMQPPQPRQSLPSIHEALRPSSTYSSPTSAPLPASHELSFQKPQVASAPIIPRPYPPSDHAQYTPHLPPPQPRQRTPPQPLQSQSSSFARPEAPPSSSYPEAPRHQSIASLQNAPAPPHNPYTPRYEPARYEPDTRAPERATNGYHHPPPPQMPYAYGPPSTHQPPVFSQPRYQPREFREVLDPWKSEKLEPSVQARQGIKRSLDVYDFEHNLFEINVSSSALAEWSAHYKAIASEQQRSSSILPERMPALESVKDMMRHQEKILVSLENMSRIINEAQQISERAILEQRAQDAGGRPGEYDDESLYGDDMKNHSFTSEGKKRRGRAAPPGRCHSCNRAETPEWRRGPDGARTLCNACGLHYAKLTRKNTQKMSQGSSGSSLRPKSLDEASPRPL